MQSLLRLTTVFALLQSFVSAAASGGFEREVERLFHLGEGQRFELATQSAPVQIERALPGEPVRVTVKVDIPTGKQALAEEIFSSIGMEFYEQAGGGRVTIKNGRPGLSWFGLVRVFPKIEVRVSLPDHVGLQVTTGSGDIRIADLRSSFVLTSGAGSIVVRDAEGSFSVKSGSGNLNLSNTSGPVIFESGSGSLTVDGVVPLFRVTTASGSVRIESRRAIFSDSTVTTASGSVSLRFPAESAFRLDAQSASGAVKVGFAAAGASSSRGQVRAAVHGGGPALTIRTNSGNILVEPL